MRTRVLLVVGFCSIAVCTSLAQHGTAPAGYYPMGYNGDTWTGEVVAANDATREIRLKYTKGDKTEDFTGYLGAKVSVKLKDGSDHELKPSDLSVGSRVMVFYLPKTEKKDGQKIKRYEIFRVRILAVGPPA